MHEPPGRVARIRRSWLTVLLAAIAALGAVAYGQEERASADAVSIDCDAGDALGDALARDRTATRIEVRGTCEGTFVLERDGVVLEGQGEAVLAAGPEAEAPALHVEGARGVELRDLTVEGGQHGILIERMATVDLDGVTVRGANSHGVEVIDASVVARGLHASENGRVGLNVNRNSELRLHDAVLEDNGISGMILFSSSLGRLEGTNQIRGNGAQGLTLGLGGMIFSIGAELIIEDNGAEGMLLLQGGSGQFLGGTIEARRNAGDGIALRLDSSLVLGRDDFEVPGEVTVEENGGHGIALYGGSEMVAEAIVPVTVRGNEGAGLSVDDGSGATVRAGAFTDNTGPDAELSFGARATLDDVEAPRVQCGEGALLRGGPSCP